MTDKPKYTDLKPAHEFDPDGGNGNCDHCRWWRLYLCDKCYLCRDCHPSKFDGIYKVLDTTWRWFKIAWLWSPAVFLILWWYL